ncbi:MAG: hypothetical protein EHM58_18195 [Ignavibacteriae bacterium]|nr:MAG: hypothetical protein EHM58_18195 [Ignavibacteriota bacterium]
MKCHELEILISDYLDNVLPEETKEEFESHISECLSCKKELEETVVLLEKVSLLPVDVAPANDLWQNIESRINNKNENGHDDKIIPLKTNGTPVKVNHGKYQDRSSARNRYLKYGAITLIAAMLLIALLPSLLTEKNGVKMDIFKTSWPVINIKGVTTIGSKLLIGNDSLKIGDWLETKDSSQVKLDVPGLGTILVEPNSKVSIVRSDTGEYRIALDYGTINADITAKPRTFFVDTKSATAIDYGCAYTLTVDSNGDGILFVKEGMVALESNGRQSLVPAGRYCMSKIGIGPGTPYRKNTSDEFKKALMKYDFGNGGSESINTMLKYATKPDAVTLVNILPRVDEQLRHKVYARVYAFVPPPGNYRQDSVPYLDMEKLNKWIEKVQENINAEVEKNLKEMEKNLNENFNFQFEHGKDFKSEEFNEKLQENIEKHMEGLEKLQELYDIPMEQIEKEMEKMEKQMENFKFDYNYNFDNEKMQREMEKAQRKMEKSQRKLEEQMRKHEQDIEQEQRELELEQERRERELEQQQRELELEQERRERELEIHQREIERQLREQERQQELEERQREREQELEKQNKEREERLKERIERDNRDDIDDEN